MAQHALGKTQKKILEILSTQGPKTSSGIRGVFPRHLNPKRLDDAVLRLFLRGLIRVVGYARTADRGPASRIWDIAPLPVQEAEQLQPGTKRTPRAPRKRAKPKSTLALLLGI